jgi:DNA-binding transcriptional LysR family regulator
VLDRMNLLFRFQAIAEAGSVRKAAEALHLTQPALSRSLMQLEQIYHEPLFERHARGVRLTNFGSRLLATISRLTRDWQIAEVELTGGGYTAEGTLRISAGPLWTSVALPVIISQLHQTYPNLVVEIGNLYGETLLAALLEGRMDISFGGLFSQEHGSGELTTQEFTSVHDRVVARMDHPIHQRAADDYAAVHNYPWIIYMADPIYEAQTLHAVVERTGAPPQVRVRTPSLLTTLRLLQEGHYLCMLPDAAAIGMAGHPIRPIPIDLGRRMSPSGALYRKAAAGYPPLQELLRLCRLFFEEREAAAH